MSLVRRRGATVGARAAGGPVTGDVAATLPALTQSATGTALVAGAVSADVAATLPALTQAAAGTVAAAGGDSIALEDSSGLVLLEDTGSVLLEA